MQLTVILAALFVSASTAATIAPRQWPDQHFPRLSQSFPSRLWLTHMFLHTSLRGRLYP